MFKGLPPRRLAGGEGGGAVRTRPEGDPSPVNVEVSERPLRRRFTAEYKARILAAADACAQPGELGALLRREGLYASHLTSWRKQREAGAIEALAPKRRGRRAQAANPLAAENERLRRENERLAARLKQAEAIIEVQKKVSEILAPTPSAAPNERSS